MHSQFDLSLHVLYQLDQVVKYSKLAADATLKAYSLNESSRAFYSVKFNLLWMGVRRCHAEFEYWAALLISPKIIPNKNKNNRQLIHFTSLISSDKFTILNALVANHQCY